VVCLKNIPNRNIDVWQKTNVERIIQMVKILRINRLGLYQKWSFPHFVAIFFIFGASSFGKEQNNCQPQK
jgi:hypothetical protein